ncbi:hypothetical protein COOONC_05539 [Cooperia oncophora]
MLSIEEKTGCTQKKIYLHVPFAHHNQSETVMQTLQKYIKGGQFNEHVSAEGLVAVVTGANSGIGLETVRGLSLAKAKVYMLCRNEERGAEAKSKLAQMGCDATRLIIVRCDLTDFSSIRECAKEILKGQ